MKNIVEIYTDGACKGNPGVGGWGVVLRYKETEKQLSGSEIETTNNRMELIAAIYALEQLKRSCQVKLITDSMYLKNGMTQWIENWKNKGWRNKAGQLVKNVDLWKRLDQQNKRHTIQWFWIKAHAGHEGNELADRLAHDAATKAQKQIKK